MNNRFSTIDEQAERLAVDVASLLRLIRDGHIPRPKLIGDLARFDSDELEKWLSDDCPRRVAPTADQFRAIRKARIDELYGDCPSEGPATKAQVDRWVAGNRQLNREFKELEG
jgi:excisionase family DNA binding protein